MLGLGVGAAGVAGCGSAGDSSRDAVAPESRAEADVRDSSRCRAAQLAGTYRRASPENSGRNGGFINLANHSGRSCTLVGRLRLVGADERGREVTATLSLNVRRRAFVLSARTDPRRPAVGRRYAMTGSFGAPLWDGTPTRYGVGCRNPLVEPARWSIRLSGVRGAVQVTNADPDERAQEPSLLSCGGRLYYTGDGVVPVDSG